MRELKDKFGEEVSLGDAIIYAVKHSTSVSQHYAFVYGIELHGSDYRLKVVSATKRWQWDKGNYAFRFYKTTLTAQNFIKLPMTAVHESVREDLLKHLP